MDRGQEGAEMMGKMAINPKKAVVLLEIKEDIHEMDMRTAIANMYQGDKGIFKGIRYVTVSDPLFKKVHQTLSKAPEGGRI